ncbi:tigger transposable element-derived protein 6-like [Dermacentor andersoni]|uniref:tigger transposable element-derived protein 6-like n=1 Tax=Dermacentor andersoni TaxID=34620 RepID=UPI0021557212|nr:tigger transposable element-derived protein 6-like [Dermacentor andersoni]
MTRELFAKWLLAWDCELVREGRKVCVLVDNCTAHNTDVALNNIEVRFLPPNSTAKLQPLDQGVIRAFKAVYKRRLIDTLLVKLRMKQDLKIDLLGAIQMLKAAWDSVRGGTIANCFRHAGFVPPEAHASSDDGDDPDEAEAELRELDEAWNDFSRFVGDMPATMTVENFVGGDDISATTAVLTDAEIAAEVSEHPADEAQADPVDDENIPTSQEAFAALDLLRRHCSAIEASGFALVECLQTVEQGVIWNAMNTKKQAAITQFFVRK